MAQVGATGGHRTIRSWLGTKPQSFLSRGRADRAWILVLLLGLAAIVIHYALTGLAQDALFDAVRAASVLTIVAGVLHNRPSRRLAWYLIAAGQLSFTLGDLTWDYYKHI